MSLPFCILMFCTGLFFLVWGSNLFIDSSVTIASHFHIPEAVIGATVLSFGTTLPEVLFSTAASWHGLYDMAIGNALGSIICNTGFIAGFMLLVRPHFPSKEDLKSVKSVFIWLLIALSIYFLSGFFFHGLPRFAGALLLFLCILSIRQTLSNASGMANNTESGDGFHPSEFIKLILESALLYLGAHFLITYGPILARAMGVPEIVISLTFIALGTSLPELITSLTALRKKHTAMSLGNILGADLLNLVLVGGLSSFIHPLPFTGSTMTGELPLCLFFISLLCLPVLLHKKTDKLQGGLLFSGYLFYLFYLFSQSNI